MNSPGDGASGLSSQGGIDQSVGWLVAGIAAILFFLLTVVTLNRTEHSPTEAFRRTTTPVTQQPVDAPEIGALNTVQ